jgi:hypothetical protein
VSEWPEGLDPDGGSRHGPTRQLLPVPLVFLSVALCASALAGLLLLLRGGGSGSGGKPSVIARPPLPPGAIGRVNGKLTVRGDAVRPLTPGGPPVPINLVFSNAGRVDLTVTGVRVTVTHTTGHGCRVQWFSVLRTHGSHVSVPAGKTLSLAQLGAPRASWPRLTMTNSGSNQNACRGATVGLRYVATAIE